MAADLDGWHITADDTTATPDMSDVYDPASGSIQVFRQPDKLTGPSIFLHHQVASDAIVPDPGAHPAAVAGTEGYIEQTGSESFTVRWSPAQSDSHAYLEARGLTQRQVVEFADGLDIKDGDIQYPPVEAKLGFVARRLPKGMREDLIAPTSPDRNAVRRLVLERGAATIHVTIDDRGEASFETYLGELLATDSEVEWVSVLGHRTVLVEDRNDGRWSLVWRQTDAATVVATLTGVDRSTVDDFVSSLVEISEDEWQDLVAATNSDAGTTESTVAVP